ncbi:MAG TPA: hypothetical protein VMU33_00490 [Burkholderiaceae bacterium]|nr:hypothetical protein [Burkholderiaceae bacterium]
MSNEFQASSPLQRIASAAAAAVVAILVTGSINALAVHYDTQALATQALQTTVASR